MTHQRSSLLRRIATVAAVAAVFALMAPGAFAGGSHHGSYSRGSSYHGSYRGGYANHGYGNQGYRGYVSRRPVVSHSYYRRPVYVAHRYPSYGGYYGGGYPVGYYDGYYRHHHWHAGDVLGALVAGAVITSVIADVVTPHTTVVERRVASDPYYNDDAPVTRYVGPDDGYYDQQ
jgi:hypothetical protein